LLGAAGVTENEFSFTPLIHGDEKYVAQQMSGHGLNLLLAMDTPDLHNPGGFLEGADYRPAWIKFIEPNRRLKAQMILVGIMGR